MTAIDTNILVALWNEDDTLNTLARSALDMALLHRRPERGLIHHTDQGTLYAACAYRDLLPVDRTT